MTGQATASELSRDLGVERSARSSGDDWQESAKSFLKSYLEKNKTMHVDSLWKAGLPATSSPKGLGAVMQHAVRSNWMEPITTPGGYTAALPSARSHQQLKPVWRSLIFVEIGSEDQFDLFGMGQ